MVHQELQVLPLMTIYENLFIGEEIEKNGFVNKKEMKEKSKKLLDMVGLKADPDIKVSDLEIAGRQLIEIARAINSDARLIILDEPTSSLTNKEIRKLFAIVDKFRTQGVSFIFISHRLEEIFEISDEIIVLKDGKLTAKLNKNETTANEVIKLMVGKELSRFL